MTIKSTLIDLGVVAVIAGAALSIGYTKGNAAGVQSQTQKVIDAQHNEQTAKDNEEKANTALGQIRAQLADQKQQLDIAQKVAAAALDARDHLQTQLAQANSARKAAERKLANETPACSDLQHLPICPELAHRLFGQPVQAPVRNGTTADNSH
jgi:preprotein translocase subunit SecF